MAEGTELGKAYVQIIPSAKGISGAIQDALGDAPDKAGASAGQSMGSRLIGTLKTVIAAAGIGQALGAAITEGAALEQSIGGVETLFKDSADTIKQYASAAYKTAGVSANSYMEQVTSFSATLLQGLGGDTRAAAEYANKAIVQMSDNANKMGTDIGSIQWAYQAFAKDNYTLLDNLKLGYGGTQAEMARLINDSGVLGDAIEVTAKTVNDVPFSKIIEAIGVIQDNLGITGTTALEAATTISGSMASVKAAFSNVLGTLTLGQDIRPALEGLAETVTTFLFGNLIPAVWNILGGLPSALVTFVAALGPQLASALAAGLPDLAATAQTMVTAFQNGVTVSLPGLLQSGVAMISQLIAGAIAGLPALLTLAGTLLGNFGTAFITACAQLLPAGMQVVASAILGIVQALPDLIATAGNLVTSFVSTILANLPQVLQSGVETLTQLVQGIIAALPNLVAAAGTAIVRFVAGVGANLPQVLQSGIETIAQLIAGLIRALPDLIAAIPQIIAAIVDTLMGYDWLSLGGDIIAGIARGVANGVGALVDAVADAARRALDAAKDFLGIASPSKVMAKEVGRFIPPGIAEGITGNMGSLQTAMAGVRDLVTGQMDDVQTRLSAALHIDPATSEPAAAQRGGNVQNIYFEQPMQAPDEIARAIRIQNTYGLAGAR